MTHSHCEELLGSLSDYLDGEASARLCAEITEHMASCDRCRVVVDTLRKTVTLYHQLTPPVISEQARERLYRTLDLTDYLRSR